MNNNIKLQDKPSVSVDGYTYYLPNVDKIPQVLKDIPRWVTWKAVANNGDKPRKILYDPNLPDWYAKSNDPETWSSFDKAVTSFEEGNRAGIGFVLNNDGLVGVDLDNCVDENGTISPEAITFLKELQPGYCEYSPSRKGLRAVGYGDSLVKGINGSLNGLQVEMYSTGRYLTITGDVIKDKGFNHMPNFIVLANKVKPQQVVAVIPSHDSDVEFYVDTNRNNYLFKFASKARNIISSEYILFKAILEENNRVCKPPLSEAEIRATILKTVSNYEMKPNISLPNQDFQVNADGEVIQDIDCLHFDITNLEANKKGQILNTNDNLYAALNQLQLKYDEFTQQTMLYDKNEFRAIRETDFFSLSIQLERHGFATPSKTNLADCVYKVAHDQRFDSAIDWGNSLKWDGIKRIDHLFSTYFGVEQSHREMAYSQYFATAMAGRLLVPGIKVDMAIVLIGKEGMRKSSAVNALAPIPDTYAELNFHDIDNKDSKMLLNGKLIGELAELQGLRSKEANMIKAWVVRQVEEYRPPFAKLNVRIPRRCAFIGTTNDDEFLSVGENNRRWLPLDVVKQADIEALITDRTQIWAEAIHVFKAAGVLFRDAETYQKEVNDTYSVVDEALQDKVQDYIKLNYQQSYRVSDICLAIQNNPFQAPTKGEQMVIARMLKHLGFEKKRIGSTKTMVWQRPQK
jgi:predicted P-loop ATPase